VSVACTRPQGNACSGFLRAQCKPDSIVQTSAVQYKISSATLPDFSLNLTNFEMDLGAWTPKIIPYRLH